MDLSPDQVDAIKRWARDTPQVIELRLFGSRAKGTSRPDSDVDVAVTADCGNYVALVTQWEQHLSNKLGLDVRISDFLRLEKVRVACEESSEVLYTRASV